MLTCEGWSVPVIGLLPTPTVQVVTAAVDTFDRDASTGLADRALGELVHQFPRNTDVGQVLLKVVAINSLYATQIYGLVAVARHIAGLTIDADIAAGSPDAVERIATVTVGGKPRRLFSFATKYCSWHNQASYPIYDTQVDACLWAYRLQDRFASFQRQDLRHYDAFFEVVTAFRNFYGLNSLTFKQLDKFLWLQGRPLSAVGT